MTNQTNEYLKCVFLHFSQIRKLIIENLIYLRNAIITANLNNTVLNYVRYI